MQTCILENIYYFCHVENYSTRLISRSCELPELSESNFFHSSRLFAMIEHTDGLQPYMAVVEDSQGNVVANLLTMLRRRGAWIPPYVFTQGRAYSEGWYAEGADREQLFGLMLDAVTKEFHRHLCFYIEFSNLSKKMFGYRHFRRNGFFPVTWMQIHNSLHSRKPEERLTEKARQIIFGPHHEQLITRQAHTQDEVHAFYKILKSYYRFRFQRFIPKETFFQELFESSDADIFVTLNREHIVGGSAVVYSQHNAYIWFEATRNKRYRQLRPNWMTTWNVIKDCYSNHYQHVFFLNVGLPYKHNRLREFILNFGGKPVSTFRWFRFTFSWLNKLLSWFFRE